MIVYTEYMDALIEDIVARCDEFRHVDCAGLLTATSQARSGGASGDLAQLIPLRFEGGATTRVADGRTYTASPLIQDGREILYIVSFLLPRFCDLDRERKLVTVFHELYHISPEFDGDIRRFPGRNYAHGSSRQKYDAQMAEIADGYLEQNPPEEVVGFLSYDFRALKEKFGGVVGRRVRRRWRPAPAVAGNTPGDARGR